MSYKKLLMSSFAALMLSACGGGNNDNGGGGGHWHGHGPGFGPGQKPCPQKPCPQDEIGSDYFTKPLVISHRGASGYLPEHTLAAYELAIRMKADYIEPDLQFTKDGVLVALHDDTLDRTTDVDVVFPDRRDPTTSKFPVSSFTLAEIKQLTVKPTNTTSTGGLTASETFPGFTPSMADPFKVPTFDEVIAFAKAQSEKVGRPVGIYPEAKQADPAMEDVILRTLADHGMNKKNSPVFIQSFSNETILSMHDKQKAQGTKVPLIVLGAAVMEGQVAKMGVYGTTMQALELADVAKYAAGVGVTIGTEAYPVTREFIEQAHAVGLKVHGWTFNQSHVVNAHNEYRKYLDMGMDGMFSNFPNLAVISRDQLNEPPSLLSDGPNGKIPLTISHRGTTGYLPEHTLGGYELAIRMGIDYIEPDLQTTADGVLVSIHDDTLTRTTNVRDLYPGAPDYRVSSFTLAQIKQLTVIPVGTASTTYAGFTPSTPLETAYKIPTFEEVINFAKAMSTKYGRTIGIYPESKAADPYQEDEILRHLNAAGWNEPDSPVIIQSFSAQAIKNLKDKGAKVPLVVLGYTIANQPARMRPSYKLDGTSGSSGTPQGHSFEELVPYVVGGGGGLGISNSAANLTKEFIDNAHALGIKVTGWTFSTAEIVPAIRDHQMYFERGMDGVFTNYSNIGVWARNWYWEGVQEANTTP